MKPKLLGRLIEDCIHIITQPFLTSSRIKSDLAQMTAYYDDKITSMELQEFRELCLELLLLFGYEVKILPDALDYEQVEISIMVASTAKLTGTALLLRNVRSSDLDISSLDDIIVIFCQDVMDSVSVSKLSQIALYDLRYLTHSLTIFTLPSYMDTFANTLLGLPELKRQLYSDAQSLTGFDDTQLSQLLQLAMSAGLGFEG